MIKNWKLFEAEYSNLVISQEEGMILQRVGNTNYFKKNMSDPWEPSTLKQSIEDIEINSVITSETPSDKKLQKYGNYIEPIYNRFDTGYPIAIRYKGRIILLDGHHRLEMAKRAGFTHMKIAVKNID